RPRRRGSGPAGAGRGTRARRAAIDAILCRSGAPAARAPERGKSLALPRPSRVRCGSGGFPMAPVPVLPLRARPRAFRSRCARALAGLALASALAPPGEAAVTVREPAYGLPHIFAATDLELARENGRVIAQDRLGQMILIARVSRGT